MHEPAIVSGLQCRRNLRPKPNRFIDRQPPVRQQFGERVAVDELHDQPAAAAELGELVQRCDVGMVQRGERARFAPEPCHAVGVVADVGIDDLDGDVALQHRVAGAIHLAHATRAEAAENLIPAEARPWCQRHGRRDYRWLIVYSCRQTMRPILCTLAVAMLPLMVSARPALADLKVGDQAPPFSLAGSDGRMYRLSDFTGKQVVVLAWFAKAFTSG